MVEKAIKSEYVVAVPRNEGLFISGSCAYSPAQAVTQVMNRIYGKGSVRARTESSNLGGSLGSYAFEMPEVSQENGRPLAGKDNLTGMAMALAIDISAAYNSDPEELLPATSSFLRRRQADRRRYAAA